MSDPKQLVILGAEALAVKIPEILQEAQNASNDGDEEFDTEALKVLRSRAMEQPLIVTLSSHFTSPIEEDDSDSLEVHNLILYCILSRLSFEKLQSYRPALKTLAEFDYLSYKSRSSHFARTMNLITNTKLLDRFSADPEDVWIPINKFDYIAGRTLWERVHTAEQMRPYLYDLFIMWQVDQCQPTFMTCRKQLARFPETAAAVAAEVMSMAVNDTELQHYLIEFVTECVPIGDAWLPMRPEVEEMVRSLESKSKADLEDDGEDYYLDEAREWLVKLKKWEDGTNKQTGP
ncbi:hypothetical protein FBEOM_10630 [Fusarium beomiforme]|uniref:DUF5071 domain-containing protein n=1 Tax=Fusarium beomiforme TaxID=44412 RepID=A0A9P5ABI3_9HYPO|nr:hypothetical protein FBEOM_10630 [Fusarium beomiforme]